AARPFYSVVRLDGPSALIAAGLVDKAIAAESGISRTSGAGYFDFRNLNEDSGGYYKVDQSVERGYDLCVAASMNCVFNDQTQSGAMISDAPNTLWAWGWYSGATVNDVYTFVPGAVGAQMTSYTANAIRMPLAGAWVPLWLSKG